MEPIVFLDIDGVINPYIYDEIIEPQPELPKKLAKEKKNPTIGSLSAFTVTQVYYCFDKKACSYVKQLSEEFHAKIVVSSSWRIFYSLKELKAILDIQDLGQYVIGCTENNRNPRNQQISAYIHDHHVDAYIVIDDFNMAASFGYHFIHTKNTLLLPQYILARSSLKIQVAR